MLTYLYYQSINLIYRHGLVLIQFELTPQMIWYIIKTWGAPGIIGLAILAGGRAIWIWFTIRQKRYDDLNDTMVSSLRLKDTDLVNKLGDILERLSTLEDESRNHTKDLTRLNVELTRSFTMIVALARVIPIKDERRKSMNEIEIRNLIKAIKDEFNL